MQYNWSHLTRKGLYDTLYKLKSEIVGKTLTPKEFKARIVSGLCSLPIKVRVIKHIISEPKIVYIGGCYYASEDSLGKTSIEVHFHYYPQDSFIAISHKRWRRVCTLFADTVLHELIHMKQARARKFKDCLPFVSDCIIKSQRAQQEYYGSKDEMEAFAFNIACELYDAYNGNISKIHTAIEKNKIHEVKNTTFLNYLIAFDFEYQHPVIKKMKRLILKSIDCAAQGKPFKSSRHLTR